MVTFTETSSIPGAPCPSVTVMDSNVTAVTSQYGDVVIVACSPGFEKDGNVTFEIICNASGLWETGTCER